MTNLDLLKILAPSLAGVAGFAYYLAHLAEHGASDLAKQEMIKFAKKRSLLPASRSAFKFFLYVSDRFFGPKILSWKAVRRSVALSGVWIALVLAFCALMFPSYTSWLENAASRHLILKSAGPLIAVSLAIDFLSTSLTRKIIHLSVGKRSLSPFGAVIIDLFLSILLFYLLFTAAKGVVVPGFSALGPAEALDIWLNPAVLPTQLQLLGDLTSDMLVPSGRGGFDIKGGLLTELVYAFPESILFLSSLLTSVWLWLYLIGYLVLYMAVRLDQGATWVRDRLKIDQSPSHAIALSLVVAYSIVCAIALAGNFIFRSLAGMG
ncbi:hypothetical protein [Pseudoduganella violaceinigra]|uniref:hypothetical protein n=1 Tax=Pseudoduganella violaceinigra TaxID=246602 RepID=UPI0004854B4E|nr:hypothetical protein [Pseudoduganella violaceinigra]